MTKETLKGLCFIALLGVVTMPTVALAIIDFSQPQGGAGGEEAFKTFMTSIVNTVWIIFVGLAVIMFIWAGIMFLTSAGDPKKIDTAKGAFLWGIVGIIVAIIAFSIITIVKDFF